MDWTDVPRMSLQKKIWFAKMLFRHSREKLEKPEKKLTINSPPTIGGLIEGSLKSETLLSMSIACQFNTSGGLI